MALLIMLLTLIPLIAWAQSRSGGSPFDLALLTTYAWVFVVSSLGGIASWAKKVREGKARPFYIPEFFGELAISVFAGMTTFLLCRWAEANEWLAAALIAISGHMGSRAIFLGEQALERWYGKLFGASTEVDSGTGSKNS